MNLTADPEKHAARQTRMKAKWNNGNGAGTPLAMAVRMPQWPTPNAAGGTGYLSGSNRDTWRPTLAGAVKMAPEGRPPLITADEHRNKTQAEMMREAAAVPRKGETSNEYWLRQPPPDPATMETWPTPRVSRGDYTRDQGDPSKPRLTLSGAAKFRPPNSPRSCETTTEKTPSETWPTPRDWKSGKASEETHAKNSRPLNEVVERRNWPTPTKSDGEGGPGCSGREGGENLRTAVGGSLNPDWTEWLLGWPPGWTDCAPLATDKYLSWLRSHSDALSRAEPG